MWSFPAAALIAFIFGAGMMGSTYIIPVFVQTIIGFTPLVAGLMMMPAGIMLAFILPAGRAAVRRDAGLDHDHRRAGPVRSRLRWMTTADIDTTSGTLVCMVMLPGWGWASSIPASTPRR